MGLSESCGGVFDESGIDGGGDVFGVAGVGGFGPGVDESHGFEVGDDRADAALTEGGLFVELLEGLCECTGGGGGVVVGGDGDEVEGEEVVVGEAVEFLDDGGVFCGFEIHLDTLLGHCIEAVVVCGFAGLAKEGECFSCISPAPGGLRDAIRTNVFGECAGGERVLEASVEEVVEFVVGVGWEVDGFVAHRARDAAVEVEVGLDEVVTEQPDGEGDVAGESSFAAEEAVEEIAGVIVRVVAEVVDFVEDEDCPFGVVFERAPDPREHAIDALVRTEFRTGEFGVDFVGCREQRATFFEVHVFDGEFGGSVGELSTDTAGGDCFARTGWAINRNRWWEVVVVDAVEDACEGAFLGVACEDFGGFCEGVEGAFISEDVVRGGGFVEEVVVLGHGVQGMVFVGTARIQLDYE